MKQPKNSQGKICKHSRPMEFYNDDRGDILYCYSCKSEFKVSKRGNLIYQKPKKINLEAT